MPEKYFRKFLLPKLEQNEDVDIFAALAEWAPRRLKSIRESMRDPSFDVLKAEAKAVNSSYDGRTLKGMAEQRSSEGIRLMMKFVGPDGKMLQAGSYLFPMGENGCCNQIALLYFDALRLVFFGL